MFHSTPLCFSQSSTVLRVQHCGVTVLHYSITVLTMESKFSTLVSQTPLWRHRALLCCHCSQLWYHSAPLWCHCAQQWCQSAPLCCHFQYHGFKVLHCGVIVLHCAVTLHHCVVTDLHYGVTSYTVLSQFSTVVSQCSTVVTLCSTVVTHCSTVVSHPIPWYHRAPLCCQSARM